MAKKYIYEKLLSAKGTKAINILLTCVKKLLEDFTIVPNSNMYKHAKYAQAIGFVYACTYQIG